MKKQNKIMGVWERNEQNEAIFCNTSYIKLWLSQIR